jgi:alpha-glucosidase
MSVGEIYTLPPGDPKLSASYLAKGNNSLHLTFDFSIFFVYWSARGYFKTIEKWQNSIPENGWPTNVFSNHDLFRIFNRRLTGRNQEKKARLLALFLLTLRGTPFIYYGEEIGMKNGTIPRKMIKDPLGKKFWPFFKGRDRARTPMQWDTSSNAGFTAAEPWLPVNSDYHQKNIENQKTNPDSLLTLYHKLIALRRAYPALNRGSWIPDCPGKNGIISFFRTVDQEKMLIILNFTSSKKTVLRKSDHNETLILSSTPEIGASINGDFYRLQPYEGIILKLG